jgi:hypothetical protein
MSNRERAREIANSITNDLFGSAERLVLSSPGEDKGRSGWSFMVVVDRIADRITAVLDARPTSERLAEIDTRRADGYETISKGNVAEAATLMLNDINYLRSFNLDARLPDNDYIGFCRYVNHGQDGDGADIITFEVCSSDAKGAFKVYAAPARPQDGEPTVGQVLAELREMFPESPVYEISYRTNGLVTNVSAFAGSLRVGNGFTLSECLAAVRKWKEEQ